MALEIHQATLGETRPSGVPIQPGDITIPEEVIKNLQLPETVTPQQITNYLSLQSTRLTSLQSTEPPYSLDAQIPPPDGMGLFSAESEVSDAEFAALEEFVQDMKNGQMGGASTSDDFDAFRNTMENILPELRKKVPPGAAFEEGETGAVGYWLNAQISSLSEERENEWAELLTKLRTDPKAGLDVYMLALGYYLTESLGKKLTRAFRMFNQSTTAHEELLAKLEFDKPGGLSAGEMFEAQTENQRYMIDTQMGMQTMQTLRQDLDRIQLQVQSITRSYHTTLTDMIKAMP